jgi:hypothetical protein
MSSLAISVLIFSCVFGSALLGVLLRFPSLAFSFIALSKNSPNSSQRSQKLIRLVPAPLHSSSGLYKPPKCVEI